MDQAAKHRKDVHGGAITQDSPLELCCALEFVAMQRLNVSAHAAASLRS